MTHRQDKTSDSRGRARQRRLLGACVALAVATVAYGHQTTPTEASAPAPGGEIVVGTIFDAVGLEPTTLSAGLVSGHIGLAIYDTLIRLTPEGVPEPFLAETVESDDAQNYTITLRDGVLFHDGTGLDADAVKLNLERHMDPANGSQSIAIATNIESITVVDDLTLELSLKFPWPAFRFHLAGAIGMIASPTAIEAGTANENPIGTGPFRFSERVVGDHTTVVRNENYWRQNEPHLDKVTFRVMLDDAVRQASIENGEIDAAQSLRADTLAEADAAEGISATLTPGKIVTIIINNTVEPFDDVRVRQALAYAIDYEAVNQVSYDGAARVAHHFVSEDSEFFDETVSFPEYDPEHAAELIADYEADNGPVSLTFRCYAEPSRLQLSELLEQMWNAAGIDVTQSISDQSTLITDLYETNFEVSCFSNGTESDDPDIIWYNALHSESQTNYSGYATPEMDAALDAGRTSADESVRVEAYATVQRLLATETPLIQYLSSPWGWTVSDAVGGLVALPNGDFAPGDAFLR